jgi:hypothetical protein
LALEIQSALDLAGYFDAFPNSAEDLQPDTAEKLDQLIGKARESFPFDLTEVRLDGKRTGYDDEWMLTAKTTTDALRHRNVRSIGLCFLVDQSKLTIPFEALAGRALTGKTVSTDFDLPEDCDLEFKIRVVLPHNDRQNQLVIAPSAKFGLLTNEFSRDLGHHQCPPLLCGTQCTLSVRF